MKYILFTLLAFVALAGLAALFTKKPAQAAASDITPIVMELFTSQSCSSCPVADKVLRVFAENSPRIIPLSCNVTYWNHLMWHDTLSKSFCTKRQRDYAQAQKSYRVFTPELRINGKYSLVGSDVDAITKIIMKESEGLKTVNIEQAGDGYQVSLPSLEKGAYFVEVLYYQSEETVDVKNGENRGKKLSYLNPVTKIDVVSSRWDGSVQVEKLPQAPKGSVGFVVLVHDDATPTGVIVAAGQYIL